MMLDEAIRFYKKTNKQLADWLLELKKYKETPKCNRPEKCVFCNRCGKCVHDKYFKERIDNETN